ncbi:MAG: sulfatase/phosphatase domain-containing protein, partial [Roseimicrobium sp.]
GLQAPGYLDGKSLKPVLEGEATSVREAAFTQVNRGKVPGHAVRTATYRYVEWGYGEQGAQLYDMVKDPFQTKNLANDPAFAAQRAELHARIEQQWPKDSSQPPVTDAPKGKRKKSA